MRRLVIDLDDTISRCAPEAGYETATPRLDVIEKLRFFRDEGFVICIHTSRNMRTFQGNIGKINANTLPIIVNWLTEHNVPYDEVVVGKPWCGHAGFYVDDRAIRPSEFVELSPAQIDALLAQE